MLRPSIWKSVQGNETAIRLYERMGFVGDGIRKAYYSDPVEDALLMTRHPRMKYRNDKQPKNAASRTITPFKMELPDSSGKIEGIYVRCMFSWNRRNDAAAAKMADCTYDKI